MASTSSNHATPNRYASSGSKLRISHGTAPAHYFEEGLQQTQPSDDNGSDQDDDDDDRPESRPLLNKGKGKAQPLPQPVTARNTTPPSTSPRKRSSVIKAVLCFVLLVVVFALLLALAMVQFLAGRILNRMPIHDDEGMRDLATKGLVHSDPKSISFEGFDQDILHLNIKFDAGFQVAKAIDDLYPSKAYEWTWADRVEKRLIAWGVQKAKTVRISFDQTPAVSVYGIGGNSDSQQHLLDVVQLSPIQLPLIYASKDSNSWLQEVSLDVAVKESADQSITSLIEHAWETKQLKMRAVVNRVDVALPGLSAIGRRMAAQSLSDISQRFIIHIPDLPFLDDPAKLVVLKSYRIEPIEIANSMLPQLILQADSRRSLSKSENTIQRIGIFGNATMINPMVDFRKQFPPEIRRNLNAIGNTTTEMRWTVPFDALLYPDLDSTAQGDGDNTSLPVLFAKVQMNPFEFAPLQPRIDMSITGRIQPASEEPPPELDQAMSLFLSRYLACKSTPMLVIPRTSNTLPSFINAAIQAFSQGVNMAIPGAPDPDAQLLTNIRIEDMRFDGAGPNSEMLCSGKFLGELQLPDGLDNLNKVLDISSMWPDVLIFDGAPPKRKADDPILSRSQFPPSPLPVGAFARLKTSSWVKAQTRRFERHDPVLGRNVTIAQVSADLHAVPMTVLPGRGDIFRSYIAKIIFHSGDGPDGKVETGTWGLASARAHMKGSGLGLITLKDVNFSGAFYVGRPKVLGV